MPNGNGNGHFHQFTLSRQALVKGANAACGVCLLTRDASVHQPRSGVGKSGSSAGESGELRSWRLVKCPECGAAIGSGCISKSTYKLIKTPHSGRRTFALIG